MNQFTFTAKQKTFLLAMMGLGLLSMVITFFADDALHTRFWSNFLHNSTFFTGIAFTSLFVLTAFITAWSGWHVLVKRIWEAYSLFMIPGLVLLAILIIGLYGGFHHLYHWADAEAVAGDAVLSGKSSFLNKGWYSIGTFVVVGAWIFFAIKLRQLSIAEEKVQDANFSTHKKMRVWSAAFLPIAGFSSAAIIWQWLMSVDAHWYSTMYAWYATASWFVSAMALTIITLVYLKSLGYLSQVNDNHLHDVGKFMFAFSIFWTYLWFSQYMLIWYANVGEETVYFQERLDNYPVLFFGNLLLNFVAPFFILMRNDNKRKYGTLVLTAIVVLFGHWWDFFMMIKPGVYHTAQEVLAHAASHGEEAAHAAGHHASSFVAGFTLPGLLEIGTFIGFLGLFFYVVFNNLTKASLISEKDPYYGESAHHRVWPF